MVDMVEYRKWGISRKKDLKLFDCKYFIFLGLENNMFFENLIKLDRIVLVDW